MVPVIYATFVLDLKLVTWDAHAEGSGRSVVGSGCSGEHGCVITTLEAPQEGNDR